ncbi:MAG: hypothetical protein EAZ18_24215, partial [Oscillatoriales cyanobacterium]
LSATGKMPVPQRVHFLWDGHPARQQQARCLFHKEYISCGMGILPVHKRLVENGATSQIQPNILAI